MRRRKKHLERERTNVDGFTLWASFVLFFDVSHPLYRLCMSRFNVNKRKRKRKGKEVFLDTVLILTGKA